MKKPIFSDNYLIIPDTHIPFEHPQSLPFLKLLKRHYEIPDSNIYSTGDFTDQYYFSRHPKSPDAAHNANRELEMIREKIRKWGSAFPELKIVSGNHDLRIMKKAFEAELPSQVLRSVEDLFEFPEGWQIKDKFVICGTKQDFLIFHGEGFSGANGHRDAAITNGISTAIGHLHSNAAVSHIETAYQRIWAINSGCLIDVNAYAFEYGKAFKFKPTVGAAVILDGGRVPLWIPM